MVKKSQLCFPALLKSLTYEVILDGKFGHNFGRVFQKLSNFDKLFLLDDLSCDYCEVKHEFS
jgi:hypothetical protein